MKTALEMDFESDHFLKDEHSYFDGNHKRVREFVILTANVHHPLLRKQLVLAAMNCKHEDSNYIPSSSENLMRQYLRLSKKLINRKKALAMRMGNRYCVS